MINYAPEFDNIISDDLNLRNGRLKIVEKECGAVAVENLEQQQELFTLTGHTALVTCCVFFANDTRMVTGSCDMTLKVWNLELQQELCSLKGHTDFVSCCTVVANNTRLVSGSYDKTLRVWDLVQQYELFCLKGHDSSVIYCIAIDNESRLVSADKRFKFINWWLPSF